MLGTDSGLRWRASGPSAPPRILSRCHAAAWADCTAHMWATGSGASRPRHSPCLARLSACGHGTGPPLPVPATCTARLPAKPDAAGPPRVVRPAYAADAVLAKSHLLPAGRPPPQTWVAPWRQPDAWYKPGLHHGASRTHGAVQPALDKTENSITVLGRNVQQNRHPGIPGNAGNPAQDPVKGASFRKTFKPPPDGRGSVTCRPLLPFSYGGCARRFWPLDAPRFPGFRP